jgi:hypothetical protein
MVWTVDKLVQKPVDRLRKIFSLGKTVHKWGEKIGRILDP